MTENVHKEEFVTGNIDFLELIKLIILFVARKINLQHILYLTAFLTFGIGDGITGAYMISKLGTDIESNPIVRYLFMTQGFGGIVMAKVLITVVIFFATYSVQMRSADSMYWSVNGFLVALTVGGVMAVNANLGALAGEITQAPSEIIFTYLALVLILTEAGSFVDKRIAYPENAGG